MRVSPGDTAQNGRKTTSSLDRYGCNGGYLDRTTSLESRSSEPTDASTWIAPIDPCCSWVLAQFDRANE